MDDSTPSQPVPLPEIAQILAMVNQSLSELPDKMNHLQNTLAEGMTRTLLKPQDVEYLEQVYACAYELYQEKRYRDALPMALHLSISNPKDVRFMFMTGMILQSLEDPLMAVTFHACALQVDPTFMPAAFRMAECYAALGEDEESREILEATLDMGRSSDEFFELQRLIMERLAQTQTN
jgi:lipopolysaccharide biosynthesis regulator YciM